MSSTINSEEERIQRSSSFTTQPRQYSAPSSLPPDAILASQQLQRELDIYAERHAPQQRLQNVNNNGDEDEDEVMVDIDDETMAAEVTLNAYDRIIEIADMVVGGSSAPDIDGQEASTADGAGDDDGDDNGNNDDNDGVQVGSPPSPLLPPPSLSPAPSEATTALLPPTPQSTAALIQQLPYRPQPQNPQEGEQRSDEAEDASSSSSDLSTIDDPDADGQDGTPGHGSGGSNSSKKGRRARDEKGRFVKRGEGE